MFGAIKSFVDFAQKQADLINNLNDLSNRSGVATDSIQGLMFAFSASGQQAESVKGILDKMPVVMASVARGSGTAAKAFDRLGLDEYYGESYHHRGTIRLLC